MKKLILIFVLTLGIISCNSDDEAQDEALDEVQFVFTDLIGKWDWISSSGGIAGITHTPESTGDVRKLEISSNTFKIFTNGSLSFESNYTIELRESQTSGEQRELIVIENGINQLFDRDDNKLLLFDQCSDCFVSVYVKE